MLKILNNSWFYGITTAVIASIVSYYLFGIGKPKTSTTGIVGAKFWSISKYKILAVHEYEMSNTDPSGYIHVKQNSRRDQWEKLIRIETHFLGLWHEVIPHNTSKHLVVVISRNGKEPWKSVHFNF